MSHEEPSRASSETAERGKPSPGDHPQASEDSSARIRNALWLSLPDQRPRRELYWFSRMPQTHVDAMAASEPYGDMTWIPTTYRRPIKRFIEAGAFAWAQGFEDQLAARNYDWVATLELCSLVTGQVSAARATGRHTFKQAVFTWENMPHQPLYSLPPYRNAFQSAKNADLVVCMVDAAAAHVAARGFDMSRVRVVKPGVDIEMFRPAEHLEERPRVVFTSPLAPNKGIDTVLEAMKIVRRRIPQAQLVVAGRGPLEGLVQAAAKEQPGSVVLAGSLDAEGVADLLRSARVFTTAPRPTWKWTEQLGLAYLEAQACGLPVVTTACGTNDEAVVPPGLVLEHDAGALAEGLTHFLSDSVAAREAGRAARERMVQEHDITVQTRRLGEVFAEFE